MLDVDDMVTQACADTGLESFGDDPGTLSGHAVPTMSAIGMLAMKEQFPTLRNGKSWRAKDKADVEVLRVLAADSDAKE